LFSIDTYVDIFADKIVTLSLQESSANTGRQRCMYESPLLTNLNSPILVIDIRHDRNEG